MRKYIPFLLALFISFFAHAQSSWQWGSIGGSTVSMLGQNSISEWVESMTVDNHGNTYAIVSGADKIHVGNDTSKFGGYAHYIVSWSCDGHVKWIKTIGPSFPGEIVTDTLGGVYIMGRMQYYYGNFFDNDTVIAAQPVYRNNYIIKYDTAGHMKWLKFPDPPLDITKFAKWPYYVHLQAAPNGDLHVLAYLPAGSHAYGNYTVTDSVYHVLKFNKDGDFVSGTRLPLAVPFDINGEPAHSYVVSSHFLRDNNNGRYYLVGYLTPPWSYPAMYIGNDTLRSNKPGIFAASFSPQGALKWLKRQDTADWGYGHGAALDNKGRLYLSGQVGNGSHWNGAIFSAPSGSIPVLSLAYAACMDSNGTNQWTSSGYSPIGETPLAWCIGTNNAGDVRVSGSLFNQFKWGNFSMRKDPPQGSTFSSTGIYFASLDPATGACIGMDSLRNKPWIGFGTSANYIGSDANNNFFLGGYFSNAYSLIDTVVKVGPTNLVAVGGTTDFFVAKYGVANCNQPTNSNNAVPTVPLAGLGIYPNPAYETVQVRGITSPLSYQLYDNTGRRLLAGTLSAGASTVNIGALSPGMYLLQLKDNAGGNAVFKVVKQ